MQVLDDLGVTVAGSHTVGDMVVVGPTGRRVSLPSAPGLTYPGYGMAIPRAPGREQVRFAGHQVSLGYAHSGLRATLGFGVRYHARGGPQAVVAGGGNHLGVLSSLVGQIRDRPSFDQLGSETLEPRTGGVQLPILRSCHCHAGQG